MTSYSSVYSKKSILASIKIQIRAFFEMFKEIWERVKEKTDLKTLKELAGKVGTTQSYASRKKQKDEFPVNWAFQVAQEYGLSTDWIMTGGHPETNESESQRKVPTRKNTEKERVLENLDRWLSEITENDSKRIFWFECNLEDNFPEYKEWIINRNSNKQKAA